MRAVADVLQLTPLLQRLPRALSGGQRQRVAIGRAIVKQPQVFLFDEPLSNLDAALRAQTRLEIARLHREVGHASMIYVTHDQVEAMTLAQKIVLLHAGDRSASHGSVAQVGTATDLYHRPASRFVAEFIGSPRINVLEGVLRSASADQAVVDVAGHTLTVAVDATHWAAGAAVHVAVRPEHVLLGHGSATEPGTAVLQARVEHLERLGESSLLYLSLVVATRACAPTPMTVRVEGHAEAAVGDTVAVSLRPRALHLFDRDGLAFRRTVTLPSLPERPRVRQSQMHRQHPRHVQGGALRAVGYLVPAAGAVGHDQRVGPGAHGRQQAQFGHLHRHVMVRGLIAKSAGHATA